MATKSHLRSLAVACAMVIAVAPSAAFAEARPDSARKSVTWAKTEAILGAPSALQAILMKQGAAEAAWAPITLAAASLPPVRYKDLPAGSHEFATDQPNVFGSVALRIADTPLSARWRSVEQQRIGGAAGQYARGLRERDQLERLSLVNRYVNRRVAFIDDDQQFRKVDVWSPAAATLNRGLGDCEDFAIAKLQMLRVAGFSDDDLYLVIVKDLVSRNDHAVLVVRSAGRMHVLDNGTDAVLDSESLRDYRPIFTFAAKGAWTHGYRVRPVLSAREAPRSSPSAPASASS